MADLDEKYDEEAYMRVITIAVPAHMDIKPMLQFAAMCGGVGQDNMIHNKSLAEQQVWDKIGDGIAAAYCKHYTNEANNPLRAEHGKSE